MKIEIEYSSQVFITDLSDPKDISLKVGAVKCFYATDFEATPYKAGDFVGSVSKGSPVNFFDLKINPHGNGTHTECLGHISLAHESIDDQLQEYHFVSALVSISPSLQGEDQVISLEDFRKKCHWELPKAVILRTLPNGHEKRSKDYSGTNPPYMSVDLIEYLVDQGVQHLLLDLPSVDKEQDGGKLLCHKAFWNIKDVKDTKNNDRNHCTITELIFVPDEIEDGLYLLNLQIPSINLDAVPSKPVLYPLILKE